MWYSTNLLVLGSIAHDCFWEKKMPKHVSYQLQWSSSTQEYVIFHDGRAIDLPLEPVSSDWFAWLETISSFAFQSRSGESCTVRKESVQRGGTYWYAYRRQGRRMVKRYLARSADLTLGRLEMVTASLNAGATDNIAATAEECLTDAEESIVEVYPETALPPQQLLTTKLHMPRLPIQHVLRPRLLTLMQQGVQGQLLLLSAPAGSGKTTLLTEWASTTELPVAWISLEPADSDPARFLSYLVAALASLDQRIDISRPPVDAQNPEQALTGILNDLTRLLEREAVVILDDYHLLTTDAVHALLRFLLDHLPIHLHLIIGTRIDPPLPLARLRARNQLSEVRIQELRFISDEVGTLMSMMGLVLSNEATNLLEQHAEGWIAGVQLLALALRGKADAAAFLRTFHGTHRFLLDYVSEEVLAQQEPDIQHFLLRTCILSQMTGSLCDAVTGLSGGQTRLADLLRANLFVSSLDDAEIWYRYHPLFAETLRAHLQKLEPGLIPELYLRASYWYEQHQDREKACDYALLADDLPRAAQLIVELLPQLVEQGRIEQLGRWLSQLPPALIAASPQLYIATPWMSSFSKGSSGNMEQALERMERHMQTQPQDESKSWVEPQSVLTLFQALSAISQNNLSDAFSLIRKGLFSLTRSQTALSQLISRFLQISLSIIYGISGDLATAEQILLDLSLIQPAEPLSVVRLAALFLLGELYKAQGKLRKAEDAYERMSEMFQSHSDVPSMLLLLLIFSSMRKTSLWYEWNRVPAAADEIRQVLEDLPHGIQEITPRASHYTLLAFGLWEQARIEWARSRPEAARYFLELVRQRPEFIEEPSPGKERSLVEVSTLAARLALICNRLEEAVWWQNVCGIRFDDTPRTLFEGRHVFMYLTLARVLIAQGRAHRMESALSQAQLLLDHWRNLAQSLDFQGWLIEIQMLTALALQAQGHLKQALTTLGAVLTQAEPEGFVRLFADEGQPMLQLLTQVSAYTTASASYLQRLRNAIPAAHQALPGPTHTRVAETPQELLDPLSEREREVLSLLAVGASNQQIADRLVISLNTAKRHVKHILAKLAVTNRLGAVIRARELHLL
jgi:LuxR family transcriptional regulator, maltose regulon positive regulatory protein